MKFFNTILFLCLCTFLSAQSVPFNINYQAIARDIAGESLSNTDVDVEINILKGAPTGTIVYTENHNIFTNQFGLYTLSIGEGSTSDNLAVIDWSEDQYYIETIISIDGGDEMTSVAPLSSVPYAFLSQRAVIDEVDDADNDPDNEFQNLVLNDMQLSITDGNTVNLEALIAQNEDTDDQTITDFSLNGTQLTITIQDGNTETVNLSSLQGDTNTDNQNLILNGTQLGIEGGNSVDLSDLTGEFTSYWKPGDNNSIYYDEGSVFLRDQNGEPKVAMRDVFSSVNGNVSTRGIINLYDRNGLNGCDIDGHGEITLYKDNRTIMRLSESLGNGIISLYNEIGNDIINVGGYSNDNGYIEVNNKNGNERVELYSNTNDAGTIFTYNENDNYVSYLSSNSIQSGSGGLFILYNNDEEMRLVNGVDSGVGFSNYSSQNGSVNASIGVYEGDINSGFMGVYNSTSQFGDAAQAYMIAGDNGHGYIGVRDRFGNDGVSIGFDQFGNAAISAEIKNFVMDHPQDRTKQIVYACIEGPEAAAYERGTAELIDGEAWIPFSDHFKLVITPESMTVNLTPNSADSKGLAVVEKTERGIRVKELFGGTSNYSFDWEAKSVRKGFENYEAVRTKKASSKGKVLEAVTPNSNK